MSFGRMMGELSARSRRFQRQVYVGLVALLLGYFALKAWHISVALELFENQPLTIDTSTAAK